ncbi:MAG: GntR family transcriptional regulator [Bacillota bacterium]
MKQPVLDKNSFVPIYYQLFKHFEGLIISGEMAPGDMLPTEMEFSEQLGISRMTVRRVISELAAAGMVYTVKGKGTFVAEPKLDEITFSLNQRFEDLEQNEDIFTQLLECRIVKADDHISSRLGIEQGSRCLFCRMFTKAGQTPLVYKTYYAIYTKRAPLIENQLKDMSLTNIASQHSKNIPSRTKRVLMASGARNDEPEVLQIDIGAPVFFMTETIYDQDNKVIAWGKSVFSGDRYRFVSYNGWNLDELKRTEEDIRYV